MLHFVSRLHLPDARTGYYAPGPLYQPLSADCRTVSLRMGSMMEIITTDAPVDVEYAPCVDENNRMNYAQILLRKHFAKEFSEMANELELAAHYSDNEEFNEFLSWQVQALLQNNEEMDMLADKHWAEMQFTPLEFTLSRENYEDQMTPTIFDNPKLVQELERIMVHFLRLSYVSPPSVLFIKSMKMVYDNSSMFSKYR